MYVTELQIKAAVCSTSSPAHSFCLKELLMNSEKAMAPHSSTLAWKIPWVEEPGRLQSMGSWRVGQDWVTSLSLFTFMHWRRQWQPTPFSCLENPRDGGAWWAAIYGVAQSLTRLKQLSSSSSSNWWTTVTKLGYLADVFVKPSQGIFLLQRKWMTLFVAKDKIWNLKEKTDSLDKLYLLLWAWLLKKKRLCFFDGTNSDLFLNIVYKIYQHLEVLHYSVKQYFPKNQWIML